MPSIKRFGNSSKEHKNKVNQKLPIPASKTRRQLRNITNENMSGDEGRESIKQTASLDEEESVSPSKKLKINDENLNNDKTTTTLELSTEQQNVEDVENHEKITKENEDPVKEVSESNDEIEEKTNQDERNDVSSSMSLKSHKQSEPIQHKRDVLSNQLLTLLSNLYLNVTERLKLDFPPRCTEDLAFCRFKHYHAPLSEVPTHVQAQNLRCTQKQQRYISFVDLAVDMCHRSEFPGDGIFMKLIELILSMNMNTATKVLLSHSFNKSVELFNLIVCTFPPCWLVMRPFYVNFMKRPISSTIISSENFDKFSKSNDMFSILLDLLENTMELCSEDELSEIKSDTGLKTPQKETQQQESHELSECFNQWGWEDRENKLQTFEALRPCERLDRCFLVLRLLLQILENDLAMWILHHHKKTKDWIFCSENRPFVVLIFDLQQFRRLGAVGKRLFTLFSIAVNKNLSENRLQVLERFIALLMESSNIADMKNTVLGVKFPYLGSETKNLIREFFKIFKSHNTTSTLAYIKTIELLRIPYVRYEFIDHFLKLFSYSHTEEMSPKKITYEIVKKRWLKYRKQSELEDSVDDMCCEQFLHLLLLALKSYCEWHGSKQYLKFISQNEQIVSYKTTTDSVHRNPLRSSGGVLVLPELAKDIKQLEEKLKLSVRVSKPKVDLAMADICIDEEIVAKYRADLKFVMILQKILPKLSLSEQAYFGEWKNYLNDFVPYEELPTTHSQHEASVI